MSDLGSRFARPDHATLLHLAAGLDRDGRDLDSVLRALRDKGANVIDSIRVMRELKGWPLAQAKDIVHSSAAWSDLRDFHDELHAAHVEANAQIEPDETDHDPAV
jgi:ribosomal protein L7/L12